MSNTIIATTIQKKGEKRKSESESKKYSKNALSLYLEV